MKRFLFMLLSVSSLTLRGATIELPPTPLSDPAMNPSPLAFFRELLESSETGRISDLSKYPEKVQLVLRRKLAEYDALTPSARELRLQATELRYYLRPLMAKQEGYRKLALPGIPEKFRTLVKVRLERWDQLPTDTREKILANEWMLHAVLRYGPRFTVEQAKVKMPVSLAARVQQQMSAWQGLGPERRQALLQRFQKLLCPGSVGEGTGGGGNAGVFATEGGRYARRHDQTSRTSARTMHQWTATVCVDESGRAGRVHPERGGVATSVGA